MGSIESKYCECKVGSTMLLDLHMENSIETSGIKYDTNIEWKFNGKTVTGASSLLFRKEDIDVADSGKYVCHLNGKVFGAYAVVVSEYLFEDDYLGIRTKITGKGKKKNRKQSQFLTKSDPLILARPDKDRCQEYKRTSIPIGTTGFEMYKMTANPRGIAVIVAIEHFDNLEELKGIKKDIENTKTTFERLHFTVQVCTPTTATDILSYLTNIVGGNLLTGDCFVLYVSSHGGNGFVCCSDYETKVHRKKKKDEKKGKGKINLLKDLMYRDTLDPKAKGYIKIDTLLEMFVNSNCDKLKNKPKLFFFDCCRQSNRKIISKTEKSPQRLFQFLEDVHEYYQDILIGHAVFPERSALINPTKGSVYTRVLNGCLSELATSESMIDVMTAVDYRMKNSTLQKDSTSKQSSTHKSLLNKKLVMKSLPENGKEE